MTSHIDMDAGFTVGDWRVDPLAGTLSDGDNQHRVEPKVMDVLVCLAGRAGDVVTRDEIVAEVWAGRVVTDDSLSRCIAELRRVFGDSPREPDYIKTVPKRGYRLLAPVESAAPAALRSSGGPRTGLAVALGSAALIIVAAIAWMNRPAPETEAPPASVAVLPFDDFSSGTDGRALGDGLSELVIHHLSQLPELAVISRNSSFAYRGQNVDVREVGRALGVGAILEGSVQASDDGVRITAQLIDTADGTHYWSSTFDRDRSDLFALQDDVARAVVAEVSATLLRREPKQLPQRELEAYELYLLGRQRAQTPEALEGVELLERAIAKDPGFAAAYAGLADALWQTVRNREHSAPRAEVLQLADEAASRAIELAPTLADGYAAKMLIASANDNFDAIEAWYAQAIERNPGHLPAHLRYADSLQRSGMLLLDESRLDRAAAVLNTALALDPLNPRLHQRRSLLAHLRGDADAMREAEAAYAAARSRAEAAEALMTLARIAADRGSLDQAIAYLMIATETLQRSTGTIRLELAAHYLQLQEFAEAERWLEQVPRPLDFMGAIQQVGLFASSGQTERLDDMLDRLAAGDVDGYQLSPTDGTFFAFSASANPLDCDRALELAERIELAWLRDSGMAFGDMMLATCHERRGNDEKARAHRQQVARIAQALNEFPAEDSFVFYERATVNAFLGDYEAAMERLEYAYDRGACFISLLERDPFLAPLHDRDRFRLLMADFRATIERMRRNVYVAKTSNDWLRLVAIEPRTW